MEARLDDILVNLAASEVMTVAATTQPAGGTYLEFTHVGNLKDQSVIAVPLHMSWVRLVGKIDGYKLTGLKLPQKIPVGTEFRLLTFPEAKAAIVEAVEGLIDQPIDIFITNDLPSLLDGGETAAMYYEHFRKKLRLAIKEWQ